MTPLLRIIERRIDGITMYRLVIMCLSIVVGSAFILSSLNILSYSWTALLSSLVVIVGSSLLAHGALKAATRAPANIESTLITALILFLIVTPENDAWSLIQHALVAMGAIAAKYLITYKKRHIFNPVALALVIAGYFEFIGADWWVGSRYMLPVVLVTGILILIKTRRYALVATYVGLSSLIVVAAGLPDLGTMVDKLVLHFLSWPTVFFAMYMLTEPLGLPGTRVHQVAYASIAALFGSIPFSIGSLYSSPELSLVLANLYTFVVERPGRIVAAFIKRVKVGEETYEYFFSPSYHVMHDAGQYLEWTFPHSADSRGIRRYFTIASRPGAEHLSFAVRHAPNQSSWKAGLEKLAPGDVLYATQCAGDYVLRTRASPYVFIAGGIGITPFISMMRDASVNGKTLDALLLYCNKTPADVAFREDLEQAGTVRVVHVYAEADALGDHEERGFVTMDMIAAYQGSLDTATFFLSGPPGMVGAYERMLRDAGIPSSRIVTDYFPGLA